MEPFTKLVKTTIDALGQRNSALAEEYVLVYQWKELENEKWITFRRFITVSEYALRMIEKDEIFYKRCAFYWQPHIIGFVSRYLVDGDISYDAGITITVKHDGISCIKFV